MVHAQGGFLVARSGWSVALGPATAGSLQMSPAQGLLDPSVCPAPRSVGCGFEWQLDQLNAAVAPVEALLVEPNWVHRAIGEEPARMEVHRSPPGPLAEDVEVPMSATLL